MIFVFITDWIAIRKIQAIYFRLIYQLYYRQIHGII